MDFPHLELENTIRALSTFVGVDKSKISPDTIKNKKRGVVWMIRALSEDRAALEMSVKMDDNLRAMICWNFNGKDTRKLALK